MKVAKSVITGGAGFIGSNLTDRLLEMVKVTVLDNFVSGKKSNLSHHNKKNLKIVNIDISKSENLDKYFKKVDYIFHLAAPLKLYQVSKPEKIFY